MTSTLLWWRRYGPNDVINAMSMLTWLDGTLASTLSTSRQRQRHVNVINAMSTSTSLTPCRRHRRHFDVDVIDAMSTSTSSTPCRSRRHRRHVNWRKLELTLFSFVGWGERQFSRIHTPQTHVQTTSLTMIAVLLVTKIKTAHRSAHCVVCHQDAWKMPMIVLGYVRLG
jgi:hypothetical protein